MNKIMEELERRFAGQAAARLDTYAGKMDALKKSTDEATKIIGEGLLDALTILSEDVSIENLTTDFEDLATAIADTVRGMAKVIEKLKRLNNIPGTDTSLIKTFPYIGPALRSLEALRNFGARSGQSGSNFTYGAGNPRADLLISKNLVKARKEEFKIIKQKNAIENKNLEELKKKFDLERIGLTAALNQATDDETKLRLKAQLAILDEDEAMAKKLLAEMEAADALKKLAEQAKLAGLSLMDFALVSVRSLVSRINTQIEKINKEFGLPSTTGDTGPFMPPATTPYDPLSSLTVTSQDLADTGFRYDPLSGLRPTAQDIRITVDTTASGDKLSQAIAESIQIATRSGYSTHLLDSYDSTSS
jgi:hypothetical protein